MTADNLTVTPSRAELWVAYHRKAIIASAPVLLAALNILRDAATTSDGINASTIVLAVLASAGLVATYFPDNAKAKLVASGLVAVGSGVTAAVTDGLSSASMLLVGTQFLAWVGAGVTENGARPDVARASQANAVVLDPEETTYLGDDGEPSIFPRPRDGGYTEAILILSVLAVIGIALLLFGVTFK